MPCDLHLPRISFLQIPVEKVLKTQALLFARRCGIIRQSSVLQAYICVYEADVKATDGGRPESASVCFCQTVKFGPTEYEE